MARKQKLADRAGFRSTACCPAAGLTAAPRFSISDAAGIAGLRSPAGPVCPLDMLITTRMDFESTHNIDQLLQSGVEMLEMGSVLRISEPRANRG